MMRLREVPEVEVGKDRVDAAKPGGPAAPARPESRSGDGDGLSAAERRARALRDNLHRRKAQARARKAGPGGESPAGG